MGLDELAELEVVLDELVVVVPVPVGVVVVLVEVDVEPEDDEVVEEPEVVPELEFVVVGVPFDGCVLDPDEPDPAPEVVVELFGGLVISPLATSAASIARWILLTAATIRTNASRPRSLDS